MSLAAMGEEIRNQLEDLPRFAAQLRQNRLPRLDPSRTIFSGSGDSYAAALFAEGLCRGEALALDPHELYRTPKKARSKSVVLISVTGKTRANLLLARRLKGIAKKRIAMTADPVSPLGSICDETVVIQYRKAGKLTSGTVSFTTSLQACSALVYRLPGEIDLRDCLRRAAAWAKGLKTSRQGSFLFIGSEVDRGLAEYGACKIQEVLGVKADAQYPEHVGHAQLFAIDPKRDTVLCIMSREDTKTREVFRRLSKAGFPASLLEAKGKDLVTRGIEVAIHLQELALSTARKRRLRECFFLKDRARLGLSGRLIY